MIEEPTLITMMKDGSNCFWHPTFTEAYIRNLIDELIQAQHVDEYLYPKYYGLEPDWD